MNYEGCFDFAAPPAAVWATMGEFDQFEQWWGWLGNLTVEGDGLRTGSVLRGSVSPPVPYRMDVRVELQRCVPEQLVDAIVHGDLEGVAHLSLQAEAEGTRADVAWTMEMMQRPMRAAARLAYPLLRWGHDRVVDSTIKDFRTHVRDLNDRDSA